MNKFEDEVEYWMKKSQDEQLIKKNIATYVSDPRIPLTSVIGIQELKWVETVVKDFFNEAVKLMEKCIIKMAKTNGDVFVIPPSDPNKNWSKFNGSYKSSNFKKK